MNSSTKTNNENLNYERIASAIEFITENIRTQPSLDEIAAYVHLSPFHFQKIFTEWAGVSPKKFIQFLTTEYLKGQIMQKVSLDEIAEQAGLSSQSRIYDLFTRIEAMTPQEYRDHGKNIKISYGFHSTPFGLCFIAVTERGICSMAFIDELSKEKELSEFKNKWFENKPVYDQATTSAYIDRIFNPQQDPVQKLHLFVKGTNFQIKVWQALLYIPEGSLSTYKNIADTIGNPGASRAVGTAIGANPIAYLIPCHRVIRTNGETGEYHWGDIRKKAILSWEASKTLLK